MTATTRRRPPAARIDFDVTPDERDTITRIVDRAAGIWAGLGVRLDRMSLAMDLTATHRNGCPLRLDALLDASDFDFTHDIGGIMRHLNRTTGQLGRCFVPRFAVPQNA